MLFKIISSIFIFVFASLAISSDFEKFMYKTEVSKLANWADKSFQEQQEAVAEFLKRYPIPMDFKEDFQEAFEEDLNLGLYYGLLKLLTEGNLTSEAFLSEFPLGRFAPLLKLSETADRDELAHNLGITKGLLNAFMDTIALNKSIVHKPRPNKNAPPLLAKRRVKASKKQPPAKRVKKSDGKRLLGEFYLISKARDLSTFVQDIQDNPALKRHFGSMSESNIYKELAKLRDDGQLQPKYEEGCLFFEHDYQWLKVLQLVQLKKNRKTIARVAKIKGKNQPCFWNAIQDIKRSVHIDYYTDDSDHSADKFNTMVEYLRLRKIKAYDIEGVINTIRREAVDPNNVYTPTLKMLHSRYLDYRKDEKTENLISYVTFQKYINHKSVMGRLSSTERAFIRRVKADRKK